MSVLTRLTSALTGRKIGTDRFGNTYHESKADYRAYGRKRRWVLFAGDAEATKVPPEWHGWLHHTLDAPLAEQKRHPWMLEHQPNATGTAGAWRPLGHDYSGGRRNRTAGDYEAWTPGS
jgi:NADH:ubiquinone oxidoreductase subunit